jgi:fibronectin type 3 domain-containing protein
MKLFATLISILSFSTLFANNLPQLVSTNPTAAICPNAWNTSLFDSVKVVDADGDILTIISVNTSTPTTIDAGNLFFYDNNPQAGSSNFWIYGNTLASGTATISISVSDGIDTTILTLPNVTVYQPTTVNFSQDTLVLCSNYGVVNLFDYVNITGGEFNCSGLEWSSTNGLLDPAAIFLGENSPSTFDYVYYDNSCQVMASTEIIYFTAGTIFVSNTNTNCTSAIGSATVTLAGGAPAETISWSTGEMNLTTIANLAAGQYTVSIYDTNQCFIQETFAIDVNGVTITPTVTDVTCYGQTNGSVVITTTGLSAPVNFLWSSGHTGSSVSGLAPGSYTVYATDANNCLATKNVTVNQPDELSADNNSVLPNCGATDGVLEVINISGGISPYTVQWSTGSTNNPQPNVGFGVYSATITDANNCQTIKTIYLSENNSADLYGDVFSAQCGQNTGAIDASYWIPSGDPVQSITWSNGAATEDIANLSANNYICTLTVANTGCRAIKGWNVPVVAPLRQDICIVTVDSLTTTNLVVWEKVQPVGIVYYNIYRETSIQGQFVLIDTVQSTNLSIFNDVVASPNERSWSYKIGAVNACNVEGPLSQPHKTIHLDLVDNGGTNVTVNWNAYEGTQFANYTLWRYTDLLGWQSIASIPNTVLSYTDNIPFSTPGLDYLVEFALTNPCSAEKAQDFNTVRSNRERGQFAPGEGTGVSSNSVEENYLNAIQVYPNPTNGKIVLIQEGNEDLSYTLYTLSGQVIQTVNSTQTQTEMDLNSLNNGMYLIVLKMNDRTITKRIVKL